MPWRDWVFANRYRGEVVARINGRRRRMQLTLSALAQLETCYGDKDILSLIDGFDRTGLHYDDAENIVRAALVATDNPLADDGAPLDVERGEAGLLALASELIGRAFDDDSHMRGAQSAAAKQENGI